MNNTVLGLILCFVLWLVFVVLAWHAWS